MNRFLAFFLAVLACATSSLAQQGPANLAFFTRGGSGSSFMGATVPAVLEDFARQANTGLAAAVTYARSGIGAGYVGSDQSYHSVGSGVARLDQSYGILLEGASTNEIPNNTATGCGSGTRPTGWPAATVGAGLTLTIVGQVTQSGITGCSYRLTGTSSGATQTFIFMTTGTQVVAAQGETWTYSGFVSLPAGSLTGLTIQPNMTERTSAGVVTASQAGAAITPTSAAIGGQRLSFTATLTNASTARVQSSYLITASNGATVDATFVIGLPQMEKQALPSSPIQTSSAAVTRAADVATQQSLYAALGARPGSVTLSAITAPGAGTQVLWEQHDGTEVNRARIYRDTANVIHAVATVASIDVVDIKLGTVADSTAFTVTFRWGGAQYGASLNDVTVLYATGTALPAGMNVISLGTDTAGNYWNGWLTTESVLGIYQPIPPPSWIDTGATMSMDFANQRYFGASVPSLTFTRNGRETAYDVNGSLVTFQSGIPVVPSYNPNTANSALGISGYLFASQWWANSAAPANQTVTPTVPGTYIAYCLTGSSGSITLTGGVSATITCSPAANGFYGATATPFTLNGSTAVTATISGSPSFMQLSNISFPNPPIITTDTVPATQNTDTAYLNLTANPGLVSPLRGSIVTRFFAAQIVQAATMITLSDGSSLNRLAANYKIASPTNQAGLTVVTNGVTVGGIDPAPPYEITAVGYHTFAFDYVVNPDRSGSIAVSLDCSPVVTSNFAAGQMPVGLNKLLLMLDEIGQPLDGALQRVTAFPNLQGSRLSTLSCTTGP